MVLEDWKQQGSKLFSKGKQNSSRLLGNWKPRTSNQLVGLDIGPDSLKVLKLNKANSKYQVENFSIANLPAGAVTKDAIKEPAALVTILKEMFRKEGIASKDVALAIPRLSTIIKTVNIDSRLTPDEIESRAWIEANRLFPDLIGDIFLDFAITGPSLQDPAQLELILVACRKDQINPYLEVLRQAGLTAKLVDVNCYALERAMPLAVNLNVPLETVALLNLNVNLSTFIVVHNQKLIHAHDQSYDGQRLITQTKTYFKEKGISDEKANADDAEIQNMLMDDVAYNSILKENLISHLRHTLHFFYSSRPNIGIQQIILAGDCASVPSLSVFLKREIGIETVVANPFANMTFAPYVDEAELKANAPKFMLCCGLALSELI